MQTKKTGLCWALAAIGGLLGGGCALDWSTSGAGGGSAALKQITCPINGPCDCPAGESCAMTCSGNCVIRCGEGASCMIACNQANCTVNCGAGATCQTDCTDGLCAGSCDPTADCSCHPAAECH